MNFLPRIVEFLLGVFTGIGPVVIIFIAYKLLRGTKTKEIFINGKEFSRSSLINFLILFIFGLCILVGAWVLLNDPFGKKEPQRDFFERRYVSKSLEECAKIDYSCGPNENLFQDDIGCGCAPAK